MNIFNILKGIVALAVGIILVTIPYSKWKEIFPKAPSKAVVRIAGVIVILAGVVLLAVGVFEGVI